ncbi:hypothetical protein DIPPA_65198 [Diplonema papillatum]|nr:hypothetical protein DIPPA_65198 [Diplonema papillatum]
MRVSNDYLPGGTVESDEEDFMYEGSPPTRLPAQGGFERRNSGTEEKRQLLDTSDCRERLAKDRSEKRFRRVAGGLLVACLLLLLVIFLSYLYTTDYQPCFVFLQEIRVAKLPERQQYLQESVVLNITLSLDNPNRVTASVENAYLRIEFLDPLLDKRYKVHEPVRLPANTSLVVGSQSMSLHHIIADIKIKLLPEGLRVLMLLHSGCFALHVEGSIAYSVSAFPEHSFVNRTQQLFSRDACPVCDA